MQVKWRLPVGFHHEHLKLCVLFLCFLIQYSIDCATLTDEMMMVGRHSMQANTVHSMSTKLIDVYVGLQSWVL